MADASWDNGGLPPKRRGLGTWAKVSLGCGVIALLMLVTCVGAGYWAFRKGSAAIDGVWSEMHRTAEQVRTDEGARALYQANPRLADTYPTVEDFLQAVAEWRPRLGEIPAQRPDFKSLVDPKGGSGFKLDSRSESGQPQRVTIGFNTRGGGRLVMIQEDGKLVDIRVE